MMAYDFGLPSLNIGEESNAFRISEDNQLQISMHSLEVSRRWENLQHPYIVFHANKKNFAFMGIYLDRRRYQFVNPNTNEVFMIQGLELKSTHRIALLTHRIPIYENFNEFPVTKKINTLREVMGLDETDQLNFNPDPSYELTMDNCLKLMAIFMRLRCNNPVVIMGETGCGKTRMIKFLSDLHLRPKKLQVTHLKHVKVHGGTTAKEITFQVEQAEREARLNQPKLFASKLKLFNTSEKPASAILFFDEANTTEAIGLIKEIMCDKTCNGRKIDFDHGLKIIAAVNPYKKHSDEMIQKLEEAGLGFYVSTSDTKDKIGHIPMRQLVYRVQPLPGSMLPLVWDFGQLNEDAERIYILQMLKRLKKQGFEEIENDLEKISEVLTESQKFMRNQKDECSFVSLRDIERVIKVALWFLDKKDILINRMLTRKIKNRNDSYQEHLSVIKKAFIFSLSVCYHSALSCKYTRFAYRRLLGNCLKIPNFKFTQQNDWVICEILKCQHIFLDEVELKNNIARNSALLENVLMMIICVELRIPLFIVGKPGSSKSLAKTIVSNAMQGNNSKSDLFRNLKEAYFVNFQCSPLTTPEMIVETFREAAQFQEGNSLEKSVAVVNLDEIGLAEASESMPLKALHPLLEEGTDSAEMALPHQKVGMIGISNWSLDPAKMNRGLFVSRGEPDIDELVESAKGICKYDQHIFNLIEPHIRDIAECYLEICQLARQFKREFFGLRDFYSLIKMLYYFCSKDGSFTWHKLEHAVKRNFSGLDIDTIKPFKDSLFSKLDSRKSTYDPDSSPVELIKTALNGENVESNSRYLLFLSRNYSLIDMIQNYIINSLNVPAHKLVVIFGSSFRHDQHYTEIVRNISRIKQSMELGHTVIMLNCYNLFESLYDALNQYYYEFAGQRYVYLGLGTHRVNCSVHENFRLIVFSEKDSVYDSKLFPIPLLNRLEKHYLNASYLLDEQQKLVNSEVEKWIQLFCCAVSNQHGSKLKPNEIFIGLNDDTVGTLILHLTHNEFNLSEPAEEMVLDKSMDRSEETSSLITKIKKIILSCATADSIIRNNRSMTQTDQIENISIWEEYFQVQKHSSLKDLMKNHMKEMLSNQTNNNFSQNLIQITTNSRNYMSNQGFSKLANDLNFNEKSFCILQSFETQKQFSDHVKKFLNCGGGSNRLLIIQSDFTRKVSADLETARHVIVEQLKECIKLRGNMLDDKSYILLVINLARQNIKYFNGFQVGYWTCYHIDELDEVDNYLPSFDVLKGKSLSELLEISLSKYSRLTNEANDEDKTINLKILLRRLIYTSCSLITDTNIERTINRIEIFLKLSEQDEFVEAIVNRLITLQKEKETNFMSREFQKNWLIKEVADLKNIYEHSSMKRSCQSFFEAKLSPLLAYILSYIDCYSNLDILYGVLNKTEPNWIKLIWFQILNNENVCKMSYSCVRTKGENSKEIKEFICKSDVSIRDSKSSCLKTAPCLPFSWLLIEIIDNLYKNFKESNLLEGSCRMTDSVKQYVNTIPVLLGKTSIYILISDIFELETAKNNSPDFLDLYLNDFLLIKSDIQTKADQLFIKSALKSILNDLGIDLNDLKVSLPLVHFEYEGISQKLSTYLSLSAFEPKLIDSMNSIIDFKEIDLDSCIGSIRIFERTLQENDINESLHRLRKLISLVKEAESKIVINNDASESFKNKHREIVKKLFFLRVNYLFFEHVLMTSKNEDMIKASCILANALKIKYLRSLPNETIFYKDTLENIHEFLCKCVYKAKEVLFRTNTKSKCCNQVQTNYRRVYAGSCACNICIVCSDCEVKMISMFNNGTTVCMVCKQTMKFVVQSNQEFSYALEEFNEYIKPFEEFKENLNKFYFHIIQLFFLTESKPDELTVETILKVVVDAKIRALINHQLVSLDLQSNYKSLIIQILFKNYSKLVQNHFGKFFSKCSQDIFETVIESAYFLQSCIYDKYFYQLTEMNENEKISHGLFICNEISESKPYLTSLFSPNSKTYSVDYLVIIGKLKCCIQIMAMFCNSQLSMDKADTQLFAAFNGKMKMLFSELKHETLFNYLIKLLIRKYGSGCIKYVMSNEDLKWITPKEIIGDNLTVADRYVTIGNEYTNLKGVISQCFQDNNTEKFDAYLKTLSDLNKVDYNFPYLCMALYQNVTLLYRENVVIPHEMFISTLKKYYPKYENDWQEFLQNNLKHNLKINDKTWSDVELNLLLIQLKYSIMFSNALPIKPLKELMNIPLNAKDSFLPTMPQDTIYDIRNAIITGNQNDVPTFYACPNGHPYVLFDCGKPWIIHSCKTCGAEIGGTSHTLLTTNTKLNISDSSMRGYCLTDSKTMSDEPKTERLLNNSQFSLVRFFIHACMYFSCDKNEKDIHNIMTTNPVNKKEFFWNHMNLDLRIAAKTLNLNKDEIIILLHKVCHDIFKSRSNSQISSWNNKDERKIWEETFSKTYLKDILDNPTTRSSLITKSNEIISAQKGGENLQSKLFFMAYERTENECKDMYKHSKFWKYLPTVNFEIMAVELQNSSKPDDHKILKQFFISRKTLKLISSLPSIIKLINFLKSNFYKSLFKHYASSTSIRNNLASNDLDNIRLSNEQIVKSIELLQHVWLRLKGELVKYARDNLKSVNLFVVDSNFEFNLDTKLSCFLPTLYGDGMIIYVMIHLLCAAHNDMLDLYYRKNSIQSETFEITKFENKDHVINFNESTDLLSIIQANFQFDSKNSKFIFRFDDITNEIAEKYFESKPLIDMKKLITFDYVDEIAGLSFFNKLEGIIKQQNIDLHTQAEILSEFSNLDEISDALNMIKTVIKFGSTTSAEADVTLEAFLKRIYVGNNQKNFNFVLKHTIISNCSMKHLKNICIVLMMKRAILLTYENQDPFENLNEIFKTEHDSPWKLPLNPLLLTSFALVIFQLISFYLTLTDEDSLRLTQEMKIKDMIYAFNDFEDMLIPENIEVLCELTPDEAKMKQIYSVWKNFVRLVQSRVE